ncbi:MAG: hypothetical protein SPK35_08095 [Prevotella sp.]|nr:hypothetical protein [Prevotella sp.]
MTKYTNAQILAAVLTKWGQPAIEQLTSGRLDNLPWMQAITNKVRSTGWVSQSWSLGRELAPIMGSMTDVIVTPMIERYLSTMPDDSIPSVAHKFVDAALVNGSLSLFEGNVVFEKEDLDELKNYLNWNLPLGESPAYEVKTSGDNE